jgi:hypothetical protein
MPASQDTPPVPAPAPLGGTEEEAWAEVVSRWDDEAVHRAYLARFGDLESLSAAGRRYRAVLGERPDDGMARRMRDVLLKKATALGLATLPRTPAKAENPRFRKAKLALYFWLGSTSLYLVYLLIRQLSSLLGSKP